MGFIKSAFNGLKDVGRSLARPRADSKRRGRKRSRSKNMMTIRGKERKRLNQ